MNLKAFYKKLSGIHKTAGVTPDRPEKFRDTLLEDSPSSEYPSHPEHHIIIIYNNKLKTESSIERTDPEFGADNALKSLPQGIRGTARRFYDDFAHNEDCNMMTNKIINILSGIVLLLPFSQAGAVLMYSGTDKGVEYSLEITPDGAYYDITYSLDTTSFFSDAGGGTNAKSLHAVSVKAFSSVTSYDSFSASTGTWIDDFGQVDANTTNPDGDVLGSGSGWLSAYFDGLTGIDVPDGIITFSWDNVMGTLLGDPSAKAIYVFREDPNGAKGIGDFAAQTSIGLNGDIPEPTPLVLLAIGLGGIGISRKLVRARST